MNRVIVNEFPFLTIYEDGSIYNSRTGKYLNIVKDRYLKYMITDNKKQYNRNVHRLLAIAFIPNPNNYPCINHKDGVKWNNELSNLEWCTHKHNTKHCFENGLWRKGEITQKYRDNCKLNMRKAIESNKIPVINTETGIYYDSIKEAAFSVGIKKGYLEIRLKGKRKNNTKFIYA